MDKKGFVITNEESAKEHGFAIPLYTQDQLEEARKLGMQQERALWNLSALTQEIMDTHPVKELNDGGEPVKNATYWKRQYNLMATQNDNLKSGLYHANEQIKYLESHPVKDLEDIDINITWNENSMRDFGKDELAFARAILRKANEK